MNNFCTSCGNKLEKNTNFCPNCEVSIVTTVSSTKSNAAEIGSIGENISGAGQYASFIHRVPAEVVKQTV